MGDSIVIIDDMSSSNLNNIVSYTYNGEVVINVQITLENII